MIDLMGFFHRHPLPVGPCVASAPVFDSVTRPPATLPHRAPLLLAYASQTGVAEGLARAAAARLQRAGMAVRLVDFEALSLEMLATTTRALFIASTTYDGDAPDMAETFCERHMREPASLRLLHYGLLALGDSGYADFCGFGRRLHAWLSSSGACALFPPVEVDDEDAEALARWQRHVELFVAA